VPVRARATLTLSPQSRARHWKHRSRRAEGGREGSLRWDLDHRGREGGRPATSETGSPKGFTAVSAGVDMWVRMQAVQRRFVPAGSHRQPLDLPLLRRGRHSLLWLFALGRTRPHKASAAGAQAQPVKKCKWLRGRAALPSTIEFQTKVQCLALGSLHQ
jgi:hypothetical protein